MTETESFSHKVLDASLNGVYIYDAKQEKQTYINRQYTKITGYDFDDLMRMEGGLFFELFHPDDRGRLLEHIDRVVGGGEDELEIEYRFLTKDGRWIWCLSRDSVFALDRDGSVSQFIGSFLDITDRRTAEESLRRRTAVLEGINRIFQKALDCETEEELGELCLEVAEEVTSSRFGVIGQLNCQGRLNDLAISDPGWSACRMENPEGRRPLATGFPIDGLFAKVLRSGKGFYTNNPPSHPESVGIPEGHPPIEAFLAVPLVHAGKAIGLVGVANRPGGYSDADLEALEKLAPAIVQTLLKKTTEEAMRANAEQKSFLLRLGDVLRPLTDPVEIQAKAARLLGEHIGASRVNYAEVLEDGNAFVVHKDFYSCGASPVVGRYRFDDFGEHAARTLKAGEILKSDDCGEIPGLSEKEREAYAALGIRAHMGVPLIKNGRLAALLTAHQTEPRHWTADEVALVEEVAHRTWDAVERSRAEEATKQSEARCRQIADAMPQLVWTASPDGVVNYCNERYKEYSGIFRKPDGSFQWTPILHEEDIPPTVEAWRRAVRTGEPYQMEHRIRLADGGYHWHLSRAIPVLDHDGSIVKWFGTATDIDRVKRAEETLRKLTENLELRVAKRTELAEARTRQLQALAVELIEAEERERRRVAKLLHDDLQQIMASAKFQLQAAHASLSPNPLVESVIHLLEESIAKSRSLSHELSPPILRHSGLIDALAWLARQMKEKFGLQVELIADSRQPGTERHFENKSLKIFLFRAVQELLFNVVKHAGVKTARVTFAGSERGFFIIVSDYGKGFDPSFLNTSDGSGGLGLLSLRERAHYLGGGLKIESYPGKGSRFILTVPLDLGTTEQAEGARAAVEPQEPAAPGLAGKGDSEVIRVLFVDDHEVMRQGLIRLLAAQPDIEAAGEARDGREAVEKALGLKPDVILMDVSMPEMDGIEATRRIKNELPDVRVIGLSMFEDEHISRVMREAGAEAFVTKTASSADLLKAIYGIEGRKRIVV